MDLRKNGAFISKVRNEHHMTQKDLAEKLGISNKTISKWENGHGFPDVDYLMPLCEELQITVTELLLGERVGESEAREKAELAMVDLIEEQEEKKHSRIRGVIRYAILFLGMIGTPLILAACTPFSVLLVISWLFDLVSIFVEILIPVLILFLADAQKDFANAFAILNLSKKRKKVYWTENEIRKSISAVKLMERGLLLGGFFVCLFQIIEVFMGSGKYSMNILCSNLAICIQSLLYGVYIVCFFLEPIRMRLTKRI